MVRRVNPSLVPVVQRSVYLEDYYNRGKETDEVMSQFDNMEHFGKHL
jgi:hypothetical protein